MRTATRTVSQLTVPQLEALIEQAVERKMLELFGDPDAGLELKPSVKAKLRRSVAAVKRGERGIPVIDHRRQIYEQH